MRKLFGGMVIGAALLTPGLSVAEDVDHYEGKKVESLAQALGYFKVYNEKFEELLEGDMTPEKMARIHEMSYTMENALGKLNSEMDGLAATLEEVHLASESADPETVTRQGKEYLSTAREIVGGSQ